LGADTGDVARGAGVVMTDDAKRLLVGDERSDVAWVEPGECAASLEDDILARTPSREDTGVPIACACLLVRDLQPEVHTSPVGIN